MPLENDRPLPRLLAAAMIIAPVLLLASTLTAVASDGGLGESELGGVLQVLAAPAFFLVVCGLSALVGRSQPRAAIALLFLGAVGTTGVAAYGINGIYVALGAFDLNETDRAAASLALQLPGVMFPLTFIGFGACLMRPRIGPRWSAPAMLAGAVLFPISRIGGIDAVAVACDLLFLAALASLGWALLRESGSLASAPEPTNRPVAEQTA